MINKNLIIEQALDGSPDLAAVTLFVSNPGFSLGLKMKWLAYICKLNPSRKPWMTTRCLAIHAKQYLNGMPLSH